jgi:hypothetical protein
MRRYLMAAVLAALMVMGSAGAAFAGEVKGPPGDPDNPVESTNVTAGPYHANSYCVFSGLNDMDTSEGQTDKITQTPADGPPGAPGHGFEAAPGVTISCKGGSNLDRHVED